MEKFSQRFRKLRETLGLTQEEMGKKLRVSGNYIYLIEKDRNQPSGMLQKIFEDLEAQHGQRMEQRESIVAMEDPAKYQSAEPRRVPIISRAQAGQLGAWEELPADHHDFLSTDCPDPQAFALRVEGDSMEPKYESGDILVLMPNFKPTNESLVVAKLANGDVMFKRLIFLDNVGDQFRLASYNPIYPPRDFTIEDIERILPVHSVVRKVWSEQKWQTQHNQMRGH